MHFVGIDLAWGERNPTGLAVLDEDGRLVPRRDRAHRRRDRRRPGAVRRPAARRDRRAAGRHQPDRQPARPRPRSTADFARFDAGAHPSNTGKPEFSDGTRGARLSARLKLDLNPQVRAGAARDRGLPAPGDGGAVPARPHPEVQGQARPRPRRSPRRAARADGPASRRWPTRRRRWRSPRRPGRRCASAVDDATRKTELRVVEDQVDAVVAAYVGLFAERAPERTTTYGDLRDATGYIVTPTLPPGPGRDARVNARAARRERRPRTSSGPRSPSTPRRTTPCEAAADGWVDLVTAVLDDAGINYLSVDRPGQERRVVRGQGRARGRRRARLPRPAHPDHRPGRASA